MSFVISRNGTFLPARGKRQAHSLFSFLENLQPNGDIPLRQSLIKYRSSSPQSGPLVLITDLFDPDWKQALQVIASAKYEVTLLQLLSPEELDPPFLGELKLIDSETNADVEITADFDLLQRYKANLLAWQEEIDQFCAKRSIRYIPLDTAIPLQELLFSHLRRQSILK